MALVAEGRLYRIRHEKITQGETERVPGFCEFYEHHHEDETTEPPR